MLEIIIKILFFGSLVGLFCIIVRKIPVLRTLPETEAGVVSLGGSWFKTGAKFSQDILKKVPQAEKVLVDSIKAARVFSGKTISSAFGKLSKIKKPGKRPPLEDLTPEDNFGDGYWENVKKQ